ncbi:uncharacterized protein N7511_003849 [Penicillium nucicola]|uniref:uncharacterized protein n=1 Tax=Penicillium nucicola TaxID=1850975 RepID=UPI002545ABFA|nr:uncharacterized protein N7511_003849 [Penicillium nucicola]KAJ5766233.1 hypothetical protein N7511_003849 [Penicillium nucicola]
MDKPFSPPIFRPRRSDDWHEYRETIEQLYRNDQLKLRDVKRIMERDYKFYASEKQYKDRLAAWHVRKNIKAKEVHIMLRKQQKRAAQGKQTAFRVNGQNVDPKRIARFVRRYGTSWDTNRKEAETEPQSPEPQTPSDMTCYTPEPAEESSATTPISPLPEMHSPRDMPPFPLGSYGNSSSDSRVSVTPNDIDARYLSLDPNHLESLPDLIIDDDPAMPLTMPRHGHSHAPSHTPSHGHGASHGHGHSQSHPQSHSQSHTPAHGFYHHNVAGIASNPLGVGNHISHGSHGSHISHGSHGSHGSHASHASHASGHGHLPLSLPHPHSSNNHSHSLLHQPSHHQHQQHPHQQQQHQHHPVPAPLNLSLPAVSSPPPVNGSASASASAPRDLEDAPSEVDVHPPDWNTIESFQNRLEGLDYTLTQTMSKWAREGDPNQEMPHHEGLGM